MKRVIIMWTLAFFLTAAFLVWQKISGPTYEVRFDTEVAGVPLKGELLRTHSITGDMPVTVNISDPAVTGSVIWRRYPTDHPWERLAMVNENGQLKAVLPAQKMAGKLEYSVEFEKDGQKVLIPPKEAAGELERGHDLAGFGFTYAGDSAEILYRPTRKVRAGLFQKQAGQFQGTLSCNPSAQQDRQKLNVREGCRPHLQEFFSGPLKIRQIFNPPAHSLSFLRSPASRVVQDPDTSRESRMKEEREKAWCAAESLGGGARG